MRSANLQTRRLESEANAGWPTHRKASCFVLGIGILGVLSVLASPAQSQASPSPSLIPALHLAQGIVVSSGNIALGIQPYGILTAPVANASLSTSRNCMYVSAAPNPLTLRYLPTNDEAMDCDYEGEGWGLGYADGSPDAPHVVGTVYMNGQADALGGPIASGNHPPTIVSFTPGPAPVGSNPSSAVAVTRVGNLTMRQEFRPHPGQADAYDDVIRITNDGHSLAADIRYRHFMSFGSAVNGSDCTYMTIATLPAGAKAPPPVLNTETTGLFVGTLDPWTPYETGNAVYYGAYPQGPPATDGVYDSYGTTGDQGIAWDLAFGELPPGASNELTIYYGAGLNRDDAMQTLDNLGAQIYGLSVGESVANCRMNSEMSDQPVFFMALGNLHMQRPLPHAKFRFQPGDCVNPAVHFTDAGSSVGLGAKLVGWSYDFGDGTGSAGAEVTHAYRPGKHFLATYTVTSEYDVDEAVHDWRAKTIVHRTRSYFDTATMTREVAATNSDCPPALDPIPDQVVQGGTPLQTVCFHARDLDDADGDLAWRVAGLPQGASTDGRHCLSWIPAGDELGSWPILVSVCDRHACASRAFRVVVWAPPGPVSPAGCGDYDRDGVCDNADDCPGTPDYAQADDDHDGVGDACERADFVSEGTFVSATPWQPEDRDRDGVADSADNCPNHPNRNQSDLDADGLGDACDLDIDGDGLPNASDNCPVLANPRQVDQDANGVGDACQQAILKNGKPSSQDAIPLAGNTGSAAEASTLANRSKATWSGALAVALAALAFGAFLARRAFTGLAVLFSRLTGTDLLDNAARAAILACVEGDPGIHYQGLVKALGIGMGALRHHLTLLVKGGLVREQETTGHRRYYPARLAARTAIPGRAGLDLRSHRAQQILAQASQAPGQSISELARDLGAPHQTISHQARRLAEAGLLRLESQDGRVRVFPVLG